MMHYFDDIQSPQLLEIALHLDQLLEAEIPQVQKVMKWKVPFYVYRHNLCYINVLKDHVVLGLYHGAHLPNLYGLLEGQDKKMIRHLVFRTLEDVYREGIIETIHEAIQYQDELEK